MPTAHRVGRLQSFIECVLTTVKCVEILQNFEECGSTTSKRIGGSQSFGESALTIGKLDRRHAERCGVRRDRSKACRKLSKVIRDGFFSPRSA